MNSALISFTLPTSIRIPVPNSGQVEFPSGMTLSGELKLERWVGPHGIREFTEPSYFVIEFKFEAGTRRYRYRGCLSVHDLWFKNGTTVSEDPAGFVALDGPIQWLLDSRSDAWYLAGSTTRAFQIKYTDTLVRVQAGVNQLVIECRYYDAANFEGYHTIYYRKEYAEILFLKAVRLMEDDYDLHGANYVNLQEYRD